MPGAAASPIPARPVYSGPPPGFGSPGEPNIENSSPGPPGAFVPPGASGYTGQVPPGLPAQRYPQAQVLVPGGEEAFIQLLRDKGVNESWTWEQTMREIITEPLYKALGTLADRKNAFSKYVNNLRSEAEQSKKQRIKTIEPNARASLDEPIRTGRVQPWLSYEGMLLRCQEKGPWKKLENVDKEEARQLWASIRRELQKKHDQEKRDLRHRNMDVLMNLLKSFEADVMTRWKDARQTVLESDEWRQDAKLNTMNLADMVTVFDELMRNIEREKTLELKKTSVQRRRQERDRREWFRSVLQDGRKQGWMHARTDFADVYDRFRHDTQFRDMMGQSGSTPLDLFQDALDALDAEIADLVRLLEQIFKGDDHLTVSEETTFEDFAGVFQQRVKKSKDQVEERDRVRLIDLQNPEKPTLRQVFEELVRRTKEEKRRVERKLRHLSEDLRYALKKEAYHNPDTFEPESELDNPWETWRPRLETLKLREWDAFNTTGYAAIDEARIDEVRRASWERFVKRQKEKNSERRSNSKQRSVSAEAQIPRKRRGEELHEENTSSDRRQRSSTSRRERRAGEATGDAKGRERHERRSGHIDDESSSKVSLRT